MQREQLSSLGVVLGFKLRWVLRWLVVGFHFVTITEVPPAGHLFCISRAQASISI